MDEREQDRAVRDAALYELALIPAHMLGIEARRYVDQRRRMWLDPVVAGHMQRHIGELRARAES